MCAFYLRLTAGLAHFKIRVQIGFGLIFSTWLVVFLSIMFSCMPFEKNWQIYPDPGSESSTRNRHHACSRAVSPDQASRRANMECYYTDLCQPAISKINVLVTVVLNVLTDMYLLTIPLPMLWRASLKPAKKAGLMVLFGMGLFVTLAGILRCVLIITVSGTDCVILQHMAQMHLSKSGVSPACAACRPTNACGHVDRIPSTVPSRPAPGPCAKPLWQSSHRISL